MEDNSDSNGTCTKGSLKVVYMSDQISLDIVSVHGLPWINDAVENQGKWMWLEDLLPKCLSATRIMEFTYQPSTSEHSSILSADGLTRTAIGLLESLQEMRKGNECRNRPIAFLAHDLGGIVVKKALVMAESDAIFYNLSQHSNRLIFFGTPHRVLNTSDWDDLILNVLLSYSESMGKYHDFTTQVKSFSKATENLSSEFMSHPIRRCIVNVYQEPLQDKMAVVNRYSATTGLVHEMNIPRRSQHSDICKFAGGEEELALIVKSLAAETNRSYAECLSALFNISPTFVVSKDEQDLYMQTQTGLHREYEDWRRSHVSQIITNCQLQGFGRSLNARSVFHELRQSSDTSTSYFGFSKGDARRQSAVSFFASIIFQILNQDQQKFERIEKLYADIKTSGAWTQAGLLVLFQSLLDQKSNEPLYLIIDRLHKCDSSWEAFLEIFLATFRAENPPTKIKIAIFSRANPEIENALEKFGKSRVDGAPVTYNSPELFVGVLAENVIRNFPELLPLKPQIIEFLERCKDSTELILSLHFLRARDIAPCSLASLRSLMRNFPPSLLDTITQRIDSMSGWSRKALGWLICAKRPFRLNELAMAVALTDINARFTSPFDPDELPLDMASDLGSALGFLVKIENGQVRFSTDILKKGVISVLANEQSFSGIELEKTTIPGDAHITSILLEYLTSITEHIEKAVESTEYVRPAGRQFDLLHYAVQFWPAHYRAIKTPDASKYDFLELLHRDNSALALSKLSAEFNIAVPPPDSRMADPLLLAAQLGLAKIVEERGERLVSEDRELAIELASWSGYADVVEILLRDAERMKNCSPSRALKYASARGYYAIVEQLLDYLASMGKPEEKLLDELICQSTQLGYEHQVSLFLKHGARVESCHDDKTPLQHAAQNGHASIVHFLLKTAKADVNSKSGKESSSPILLASKRGYQTVVRHLLDFQADIAGRSSEPQNGTALHAAAGNGHEQIVKLLVSHIAWAKTQPSVAHQDRMAIGTILDAKDHLGRSPLILACIGGYDVVARVLLDVGADILLPDNEGNHALNHAMSLGLQDLSEAIIKRAASVSDFADIAHIFLSAAQKGFTNVVRACVESGIEVRLGDTEVRLVDFSGIDGKAALHLAAGEGHDDIVRLLLDAKALVDEMDRNGRTPLTHAALAGKFALVETLLDAGANALTKNHQEETIVNQVADQNCSSVYAKIIDILIKRDVDVNSVGNSCLAAVHRAAAGEESDVLECLLRHEARVNVKDPQNWNALHYAAQNTSASATKIARLLIVAGVDPLEPDEDGWLPIHIAARWGNVPMLELLWEEAPSSLYQRTDDGRTLIHFAYDEYKALKWALSHDFDVDSLNFDKETTLMLAAAARMGDCVSLLLDHHADVSRLDVRQKTCLHHAAMGGEVDVGRQLLEADLNLLSCVDDAKFTALYIAICADNSHFALMLLEKYHTEAHLTELGATMGVGGELPLIVAIQQDQKKVVEKLLDLGVDAEVRSADRETALAIALRCNKTMVHLLLSPDIPHGANINSGGGHDPTALYEAARTGSVDRVKILLDLGAQVDAEGGRLNTALCAALFGDYEEIVDLLLREGADIQKPGGEFPNALGAAILSHNHEAILNLIEREIALDAQDPQGRTNLHLATSRSTLGVVDDLLKAGADPSIKDKQGRTIFHHAATNLDVEMILRLLEDPELSYLNVADNDGWTPLHWATRQRLNLDVVMALIKHGADPCMATPDGRTPESIAVFHNAREIAQSLVEEAKKISPSVALTEVKTAEDIEPDDTGSQTEDAAEPNEWETGRYHLWMHCDGCFQKPIYGTYWHYTDADFDYCFKCYWTAKDTHPGQEWKRLQRSGTD